MNWIDIASIVFVCVTMNHLGLTTAFEELLRNYLTPKGTFEELLASIKCPKCLTFWSVLAYELWSVGFSDIPMVLAISFLASYSALWLELSEGFIDTLYMKLYDKIYETSDDTPAADADGGNSASAVSELPETKVGQITSK